MAESPRITRRLGHHRWARYPDWDMKSLFDDGEKPPTLNERLSGMFSGAFARPPKPKAAAPAASPATAPAEPQAVLSPAERRRAMSGLDAMETKWSKGGLAIAGVIGAVIVIYLAAYHPTKKVTDKVHGVTHTHLVPLSDTYLLVGAIVVAFCLLGFEGIRRKRRTLVAFAFFINGFALALVFAPLGLALLVLGGWLMLRAYRIQKFGTPNAKQAARVAAARPPRRERKQAARTPLPPTGHKPPTANKRYTPKAAPRKKVARPTE
jgi:hypothetical protein